jgi:hypothetical protein
VEVCGSSCEEPYRVLHSSLVASERLCSEDTAGEEVSFKE